MPALAAAYLRAANASVSLYDANQDFFCGHLLDPPFLQSCLERVQSNTARGLYQGLSDSCLSEILESIGSHRDQWQERCAKAGQIAEVMRSETFYDPTALVRARGELDLILALASLAFFPLRLHWNGLFHPGAQSWEAAWAFSKEPDNLFHLLSKPIKDAALNSQSLVFCVQYQDQVLPALSLLAVVKAERPDQEAVFWGPGLTVSDPGQQITWLANADPAALCPALGLTNNSPQPPDYQGLENCLAPELVTGGLGYYEVNQAPSLEELKEHKAADLAIASWRLSQGTEVKNLEKALRIASKAGMWNKIELVAGVEGAITEWCAANPNLAHSIVIKRQPGPGFCGSPPSPWPDEPMVGTLPPMPGRPLWRWLDADPHLALYLRRHGVREVRNQRVRDDRSLYTQGQQVDYHFVHYPDLNQWHIKNILKLITFAGKVKPNWLRYNLEHSYLIAYALEEGVMVATETLKHPRPEYIQKVRERTGLDFTKYLERGYFVVRPEYRGMGVGDYLVKECLARAEGYKTFLTVAAENKTAKEMTFRHGTRFLLSYFSEEMGKQIEIWTPGDQENSPSKSEAK